MTTASNAARRDDAAPLTVDVDSHQTVFAGAVAADAARPPDRLEILLAGVPQPDAAAHERVTAALLALAHGALPHFVVKPLPARAPSANFWQLFNNEPPPGVRIRIPTPATDKELRDSVSRLLAAVNSGRYGDDTGSARVTWVDHIFAGCTPFEAAVRNAALTRVVALGRTLGTPANGEVALQLLPVPRPLESSSEGSRHCMGRSAIFPDASLPSSASYRLWQRFAFAQRMRFAVTASAPRAHDVWALWSGSADGPRLKVRAPTVLLTVEGNAVLERRPAGTLYTYEGPNGSWNPRDVTLKSLEAIRRRLLAAGIANDEIAMQLRPDDGRWYVRVRSPDIRRNDAVVAAMGGVVESERDAVKTTTLGDTCVDEQRALARAVVDARARARRVAFGLGASIELAPVAVRIAGGIEFTACTDRGMEYAPPGRLPRHISGRLQLLEPDPGGRVVVLAVFRIEHPQVSGPVRSHVASDDPTSVTARFGYAAPSIDYPDAAHQGTAQLEMRLHAQRVRVDTTVSPDNQHGFAAIDVGLAARLATTLSASTTQYTAAYVADDTRGSGMPTPNQMIFDADLPNHGSATAHALNAALASLEAAGYGGFSILPQSDACAAVDDALAIDAIRAAARDVPPPERAGHVVAIDLRGPFTVDGRCGRVDSGVPMWVVRDATVKDVRLAAYARVSYGHERQRNAH